MSEIRPERPADYAAIADINIRAFGNRANEANIVALMRQRPTFTPDLALVAVADDTIVGHVLLTPCTLRLLHEDVQAVLVAPIAVAPAHQGQGIGRQLMESGHEIARAMGYDMAFLIGHTDYYPRFGYETFAFGTSQLTIATDSLSYMPLEMRPPAPDDLPALMDLWMHEEQWVDFALHPAPALVDWISFHPSITARVYEDNGEIVGYSRTVGDQVRMFLAAHAPAAHAMAKSLGSNSGKVTLPIHPKSASATAFRVAPTVSAHHAGMALPFNIESPLADYFGYVRNNQIVVGRPIWFTAFDLA